MKAFTISLNFGHSFRLIRPGKFKVPKDIEIPVYLIRHELQNRMLFKHLQVIGLEGCHLENFLDNLILASLGMWDATDETSDIFFKLIEKWSDNLTTDNDVITRRAIKIYYALAKEKRTIISLKKNKKSAKGNQQ